MGATMEIANNEIRIKFVNHTLYIPYKNNNRSFKRDLIDENKNLLFVQGYVCQSQLMTWMHICS